MLNRLKSTGQDPLSVEAGDAAGIAATFNDTADRHHVYNRGLDIHRLLHKRGSNTTYLA